MTPLGHKEMIETVEQYTKNYTLIKGYCDVVVESTGLPSASSIYKNYKQEYKVKDNNFWILLGNMDNDFINHIFNADFFTENEGIKREGCYEYNAALYHQSSTWEEPGESYIDYIDFKFIETFESRTREEKLNQLFD